MNNYWELLWRSVCVLAEELLIIAFQWMRNVSRFELFYRSKQSTYWVSRLTYFSVRCNEQIEQTSFVNLYTTHYSKLFFNIDLRNQLLCYNITHYKISWNLNPTSYIGTWTEYRSYNYKIFILKHSSLGIWHHNFGMICFNFINR